jgi:hypothetical protein
MGCVGSRPRGTEIEADPAGGDVKIQLQQKRIRFGATALGLKLERFFDVELKYWLVDGREGRYAIIELPEAFIYRRARRATRSRRRTTELWAGITKNGA